MSSNHKFFCIIPYLRGAMSISKGLLGYATFPWQVGTLWNDGIVLRYTAIPGGSEPGYTIGITLVHEVGHWLGVSSFPFNKC
jgi:hypothetical protein